MTGVNAAGPARFAALRDPACAKYLVGSGLGMMGDNIEHVITYWVLWQRFHSPALVGFEVISHWTPFLLFSVTFGSWADRFDCRRIVQASQALFAFVSVAWGVLFLTGTLSVPAACVLLVLHGCAGAMWGPAEQLMLHDFVGPEALPSAVRLNATARSLGILLGPAVGTVLLVGLGPTAGIFANVLCYLPLIVYMARTSYTGHLRDGVLASRRPTLRESLGTLRRVLGDRTMAAMIVLAGLGSFFIGAAVQTAMPVFAGVQDAPSEAAYGILLVGLGAGGVLGGLLLEAWGRLRPTAWTAVVATFVYGATILLFAVSRDVWLGAGLLLLSGVAALASMSITQTVAQLTAPPGERGQVLGLYGLAGSGLRIGSGVTVGILGGLLGVETALAWSAAAMCVGVCITALWLRRA